MNKVFFLLLQNKPDEFLQSINQDFLNNQNSFLLALVIFLAFPLILLIIYVINQYAARVKLIQQLKIKFTKLARHYDLSLNEINIIKQLSRFLQDPQKKYLLLINKNTFNFCLDHWENKYPGQTLTGLGILRNKLEFDKYDPLESPKSTYNLYVAMPVQIRPVDSPQLPWIKGHIQAVNDDYINLEIQGKYDPLEQGTRIKLALHDHRGVFLFESSIVGQDGSIIRVHHSRNRLVVQRRKYFRKQLNMKVFIKKETNEQEVVESQLIDLSGSGASLNNPDKSFKKHDDLLIFFHTEHDKWLRVSAEVVRLSHGGKTMHIRFGHLKEALRDNIIGLIR
ncbi:MAG: PilZ domain-containing protein [Spirochaetales bacterium]|nr:PilZ domain-containing protein [Spirochaetales bacterium]